MKRSSLNIKNQQRRKDRKKRIFPTISMQSIASKKLTSCLLQDQQKSIRPSNTSKTKLQYIVKQLKRSVQPIAKRPPNSLTNAMPLARTARTKKKKALTLSPKSKKLKSMRRKTSMRTISQDLLDHS